MPADGTLEIKHEVSPAKIAAAQVKSGEKYQALFTNKCLGTRWWAFGSLEEFKDVRFGQWKDEEEREREEGEGDENREAEKKGKGPDEGKLFRGESPDDLALIIEVGTAEFEIG